MPYIKRYVYPLHLSNKPLPKGCGTELETIANNSLCGLIRQLSDISDLASGIFLEIAEEAAVVNERTLRLRLRAGKIEEYVAKLDARAVRVPESSLAHFKQLREHFRSPGGPDKDHCIATTRPPCVSVQYDNACTNLKDVYDKLKEYHDNADEVHCSISISTTMLACSTEPEKSEYEFEFPRPIVHHSPKQRRRRPMALTIKKSPRPHSEADILEDYFKRTRSPLPTPEEVMRQNVTPSSMVPIDVTGSGFERMASFRRSLTPQGKKERKKRRSLWRRTISGVPDAVQTELSQEAGWRSDTSLSEQNSSIDYELKTQSLDRRSFRKHQKERKDRVSQDDAVVAQHRTHRRPKSNRTAAPVAPSLAPTRVDKDNIVSATHDKQAARLSLPLDKLSSVNGSNDSSLDKVWMASSPVRPKSLEFSAHQISHIEGAVTTPPGHPSSSRISTVAQTHHIPNAIIPTTAVTRTINTQRTTMADSQTIPNGTLPYAMYSTYTTAPSTTVKLRETKSGAKKEERHSSSGNWSGSGSGTDSTRTSVNSDVGQSLSIDGGDSSTISPSDSAVSLSTDNVAIVTASSTMNGSLQSVDSALGNGTVPRPHKLALPVDTTSDLSGSPTPTNSFNQVDADYWLRKMGGESESVINAESGNEAPDVKPSPGIIQIGFPDNASDSSSSENPSSSQNFSDTASIDLEVFLGDGNSFDSDSLSSFSVDTEGYWTSMHSDCGLPKRGKGKPSRGQSSLVAGATAAAEKTTSSGNDIYADADEVDNSKAPSTRKEKTETPSINVQQPQRNNGKYLEVNTKLLTVPEVSPASSASSIDTDTASEASYDLGTAAPLPPDNPRMYKLCYSGSNSSVESQRNSSSREPSSFLSEGGMTTAVTSSQTSLDSVQSTSSAGSVTSRNVDRSRQAPPISSPSSTDSGVHFPVSSPTNSGAATAPSRASITPLGQMTVHQAQQQRLQSQLSGKAMIQSAKALFLGSPDGTESSNVTPVSSPTTLSQRVELMSQRSPLLSPQSPMGMYPEKYNTLQRRTRIQAGWEAERSSQDGGNTQDAPLHLVSPTAGQRRDVSPQERQQLFQDYVNTVQNQATQNYGSLGGLADFCNGRNSALTREQRAEILDLMRRSKHSRPACSPMEVKSSTDSNTSPNSASFRSSYHEGIESGHLDPDMAIIRAAEKLEEQNRTGGITMMTSPISLQPLKTNITSPEGDWPLLGPTPSGSPKIMPDEPRTPLYVFDPNRQPKNGILKAKKTPQAKGAPSEELDARIHAAKKKLNITTDPFAKQGNRPMSPSEWSAASASSSKGITFSDTVHVDNMPVKVCSVSGKPQTSMDDFKALLQQRQKIFRPFNATARLSSSAVVAQNIPKSKLDDMLEPREEKEPSTPERRIVTVYALRNAMANARSSTRTNDLGLPYSQLQVGGPGQKLKSSSDSSPGMLTKDGETGSLPKGVSETNLDEVEGASVRPGVRETDLRFLSPDEEDGHKEQIMQIMDKMDEDEKEEREKMEKDQEPKQLQPKSLEPKEQDTKDKDTKLDPKKLDLDIGDQRLQDQTTQDQKDEESKMEKAEAQSDAVKEGAFAKSDDSEASALDTRSTEQLMSPQTDPTRVKLLESIRLRGSRRDSRQEAIKMLEALKTIHEKPDLTIEVPTPTDGSISTLLDNMKSQMKRFPQAATSPNSSEHDYGSDAWD